MPWTTVIDEEVFARPRFSLLLLSVFAGVGLLLAVVGVYGVVAYSVAQQRPNSACGSRSAPRAPTCCGSCCGRGLRLMAFGTLAGLVLALVTRVLARRCGRIDPRPAAPTWSWRSCSARRDGGEPAAGAAAAQLEPARARSGGSWRYRTTSCPPCPPRAWPGNVHTNG